MLWTWPTRRFGSVWNEMDRLQNRMNELFNDFDGRAGVDFADYPAVNVWTSDNDALLTAELPGVDPADIDVTVKGNTVTIRGQRKTPELGEGEAFIRRERGSGSFVRSLTLPFEVEGNKVSADYRMGILQLTLPRAEADKPKRITVNAG